MPAKAVASMRFVTMKSVTDYISTDNLLTCWGGTDDYQFEFEPEQQPTDANGRHETDAEKLKRVRRTESSVCVTKKKKPWKCVDVFMARVRIE